MLLPASSVLIDWDSAYSDFARAAIGEQSGTIEKAIWRTAAIRHDHRLKRTLPGSLMRER